jgi:plasmid maintenance system antidote protein VapI
MRRTSEYTEFGKWLKIELMTRNITLREFAEMVGVNYRVVSDVMTGKNKSHQDDMRIALERYDRRQGEKKAAM